MKGQLGLVEQLSLVEKRRTAPGGLAGEENKAT
jgi:hypothetical protein